MKYFNFPIKDASIYSKYPRKTTGIDEILDVGKTDNGTQIVRSLIQFDISEISQSISDGTYPINSEFELKLFLANADRIIPDQILYAYPISSSWSEGTGYFYQDRISEIYGVTWYNNISGSSWISPGSDYISSLSSSVQCSNPISDVQIDITSIVRSWLSGTYNNNGILVKFSDSAELDNTNQGKLSFFSKDTHTIYKPSLITKIDTSIYNTGSYSSSANLTSIKIQSETLQQSYESNQIVRVYLNVRELYPIKNFDDIFSSYAGKYYLPSSSYFSIVDVKSNAEILPFDNYSKININGSGSYIEFSTKPMYPLRYYKLKYKIIRNGLVEIYDDKNLFTIRQS